MPPGSLRPLRRASQVSTHRACWDGPAVARARPRYHAIDGQGDEPTLRTQPARSPDRAALGGLDDETLLLMYRQMVLIRRFEEHAAESYAQAKVGGFLHLYIGEEAVAVGALHAARPDDHLITHYRDHGYALVRGIEPGAVMEIGRAS